MSIKTISFFSSISSITKIISYFLIAKILAVYVGPKGFALIGQFQNFTQLILALAGNMLQNGIIKYTAEKRLETQELEKIIVSGFWICIVCSFFLGIGVFFTRSYLSIWVFNCLDYRWLFTLFAATIILYVLNTWVTSILNGIGEVKKLTLVNISNSIFTLLLILIFATFFSLTGALLALILSQSLVFFLTIFLIKNEYWCKCKFFYKKIDWQYFKRLFSYGLMAITTTLICPVTQILIRQHVVNNASWQVAGYWQAVSRVSDGYLMVIQAFLTMYYFPRLSSLKKGAEIKNEIINAYKYIFSAVILLALGVYFFKNLIILVLYSKQFLPMKNLFLFQLIGDVCKIGAFLFAYLMWAKSLTKLFIISEIAFNALLYGLSIYLINWYGVIGATYAFALTYFLYWVFMYLKLKSWMK